MQFGLDDLQGGGDSDAFALGAVMGLGDIGVLILLHFLLEQLQLFW